MSNPGAPIRVEIAPDLPPALGDPERNWQVLTNLLSNAVKFSDGATEIAVRVTSERERLRVEVADQGPGISPEDMPRLFQKFSRIRSGDGRGKVKRTGLGLYICKCMVEAQGGEIWAESVVGRGTSFLYTMPAADRSAAS